MLAGTGVEAMKAVAKAYQARSLQDFQSTLTAYREELVDDSVVHLHLSRLYDTLLEQNLCRLIEPYSRVEIEYLAKLIKLPPASVLTKLSQVGIRQNVSPNLPLACQAENFMVLPHNEWHHIQHSLV